MAWSPCPWKRFPGTRQPDHQLPTFSHGSRIMAARATRVRFTPTTARETRLVHRTHHLPRGYSFGVLDIQIKQPARALLSYSLYFILYFFFFLIFLSLPFSLHNNNFFFYFKLRARARKNTFLCTSFSSYSPSCDSVDIYLNLYTTYILDIPKPF